MKKGGVRGLGSLWSKAFGVRCGPGKGPGAPLGNGGQAGTEPAITIAVIDYIINLNLNYSNKISQNIMELKFSDICQS